MNRRDKQQIKHKSKAKVDTKTRVSSVPVIVVSEPETGAGEQESTAELEVSAFVSKMRTAAEPKEENQELDCFGSSEAEQSYALDSHRQEETPVSELEVPDLPSRYQVTAWLGEGGMASVYKACDTACDGKEVAIKVLRRELARDPSVVERFFREARAAQKVAHANLVQVHECATSESGAPYMVMELIDGKDLAAILREETRLPVERSLNIFTQLCEGLSAAHDAGLVHRDVKPSNILVFRDDDGTERVKLVDFGIAKPSSSERAINPALTHTGSILGSPAYMSPEQCLGHVVDERSDIYSLGCVMYETLTGRSPFASDTPVKSILKHIEHNPEPFEIEFGDLKIPSALEDVVLKCLAKEPRDRLQKVYQLRDALATAPAPGIWRRNLSFVIDAVCVFFVMALVANVLRIIGAVPPSDSQIFFFLSQPIMSTYVLAIALYFALFEASRLQATPGKLAFGLKVYDPHGARLGVWNSLAGNASVICLLTVLAPLVSTLACFWFGRYNHFCLSVTVPFLTVMWFIVLNALPAAFNHGRQDLMERLFKRVTARTYQSITPSVARRIKPATLAMTLFFLAFPGLFSGALKSACDYVWYHGPSAALVARERIAKGTVITADMVGVAHTLPFLNAKGAIEDARAVIGRRAARDLAYLDAVTEKALTPDGAAKP